MEDKNFITHLGKIFRIFCLLFTVSVSNEDKVETEYVVSGVVRARGGLVQAVEVEPIGEDGKCAEELQHCKKLGSFHDIFGQKMISISYQGVESNVPGSPLQVGVERAVHDGLPPPRQLGRPPLGRPARALRPQRPHRRRVRVDRRPGPGDARGLLAQRGHSGFLAAGRLEIWVFFTDVS